MTTLLEIREKIKVLYGRNEVFILPIIRFLLAFWVFATVNGRLGYMAKVDNIAIVLIAALTCSFLPNGCMLLIAAVFSLLHMYAMSMEVALVGLCVYLLLFLVFYRFSSKDSLVLMLTALLCLMKLPYIMPIAMGLIGTPVSAISVGSGVIVYYLLQTVISSAPTIATMEEADATGKIRLIVDGLLSNKEMLVMVTAFAITVIAVYLLRRMAVDYSWSIAMVSGAMINLVILLVGDLLYDTNVSVVSAILGSVVAILVAKVIEFFRFCVDYSRTERVQFEDDEYYYYVKAVPKMMVSVPTKTVKRINTQRRPATTASRSVNTGSVAVKRMTAAPKTVADKNEDDYEELF